MVTIAGETIPELYSEAWWAMRINGVEENSRNGLVMTIQEPAELVLWEPTKRVLFDPRRDANPFFHVMEAVWMFSGSSDVGFVEQFNKKYRQYAEPNGTVWGAYGARWMSHFGPGWSGENPMNQITEVIQILKQDTMSRQAVIAMWDPSSDLGSIVRDKPCNTHIYLRIVKGALHMTVCNRSNDMVWGALGANVVHMTLLQELIARGVGVPVGTYRVLSNNLHVYKDREDVKKLWDTNYPVDPYLQGLKTHPLLQEGETVEQLLRDCGVLTSIPPGMKAPTDYLAVETVWVKSVAHPMYRAYLEKERRDYWISRIEAEDWRLACEQWADRHPLTASSNPSPTAPQDS